MKSLFFSDISSKSLKSSLFGIFRTRLELKSLVFIQVLRIAITCLQIGSLSFPRKPWSSCSCYDRRCSYFTRNIWNRYVDSFKTLFRTRSQAGCAIVTSIWRPDLLKIKLHIKTSSAFPLCIYLHIHIVCLKF